MSSCLLHDVQPSQGYDQKAKCTHQSSYACELQGHGGDIMTFVFCAGSLTNLAKYPASTVQILGAEKALFRCVQLQVLST